MELKEFEKVLQNEVEFKDIDKWKFKWIPHGTISKHTYIATKDDQKYFVKEIKDNEKLVLLTLTKLKIGLTPKISYPDLLSRNVLVQKYVSGGHVKSKKAIDTQLIRKFAKFQNFFNEKIIRNRLNKFSGCKFTDKDDGFFRGGISNNFEYTRDLLKLRKYKLRVVENCISLLNHLRKDKERIINDFSTMPFARQHHDFKEDNIVGKPQRLVDWGSSYGHGPFLFDLAPFLVYNKKAFSEFVKNSNICRKSSQELIKRWLYVALTARFVELLRYRLKIGGNFKNKVECKKYLEYEYKTYRYLLE